MSDEIKMPELVGMTLNEMIDKVKLHIQKQDATIAALREEVERLELNMDWQEAEKLLDELLSLRSRLAALESKLKSSEEIRVAEKKILIAEIEKNAALQAEVERLKEERDDAVATRIPPSSGALLDLGARLTELLDEDDWNNLEPLLLATKGAREATEKERDALRAEVKRLKKLEATCHCGERVSAHNMGSGHSPVEMQERCPYESRLAVAEGKVEKVRKTINDPMVCEYQQMRNRLNEDIG